MAETLPPNTHDLDVRVRVTLPTGETVEQQDVALLLTGEDFDPWPGVQIHDVELLAHQPADAEGADLVALARFGLWCLEEARGCDGPGDVDGGALQGKALELGLLTSHEVTERCESSFCACEEYGFPATCIRNSPALERLQEQLGEISA